VLGLCVARHVSHVTCYVLLFSFLLCHTSHIATYTSHLSHEQGTVAPAIRCSTRDRRMLQLYTGDDDADGHTHAHTLTNTHTPTHTHTNQRTYTQACLNKDPALRPSSAALASHEYVRCVTRQHAHLLCLAHTHARIHA